jgi:hypothetical protein
VMTAAVQAVPQGHAISSTQTPHVKSGGAGARSPGDVHPRTCFRVPLDQAVETHRVELLELVVVRVLVLHCTIEKREPAISVDHTRHGPALMHAIGDDCETRARRMVAVRRH